MKSVPNSLCATVRALATIVPSGERTSSDQITLDLAHAEDNKQTPRVNVTTDSRTLESPLPNLAALTP